MKTIYNLYCDESCHLEHDHQKAMVLGVVWCPEDKARAIAERLREIKRAHGLSATFEAKWTKVSPAKVDYYLAVIDYFFDADDLHYRALVVPDKSKLTHDKFGQDHDTWYYKMYFQLLSVLFNPDSHYRIYLDIKDTVGSAKVTKLHDVLCKSQYDFDRQIIERVQTVRSHEIEQLQVCDLLSGALAYVHRGLAGSAAKQQLIERIKHRSGLQLTRNTLLRARKFNLFCWEAGQPSA
ncbi:MAG: DUF3800 domain-containing protein [Opitutus sp.]|nr:DUF3800 domain-containing protein [Opitutus sp.]MCS6246039.1 DUF3800 domain-containing protein [Opitutus sp.]MCS6273922.1 DUF3800 domain-containing protein [Opitutus sp.]MCS6276234.1 DUF3800 domain-containing protein [Opitutus sp.]MCS6301328.1 DUF3800 domain-containing protein [Opitutus sp.]